MQRFLDSTPRPRSGAGVRIVGRGIGLLSLLAACTLANDDFAPNVVGVAHNASDAGAPAPPEVCSSATCDAGCTGGSCAPPDAGAGAPACENGDCQSSPPLELAPSCSDGAQNGDESGVDCGGACPQECALDVGCRSDADCAAGAFCPAASQVCTLASCDDGVQNGAEVFADCGGGECPACADGAPCAQAVDCASGVCAGGVCAPPACTDAIRNADETDVDCGGACGATCDAGQSCLVDGDCGAGLFCPSGASVCTLASCDDGVRNAAEVLVDCGGGDCPGCPDGTDCNTGADCESSSCVGGVCAAPSCNDDVLNQNETGIDCGGGCAANCPTGTGCRGGGDCQSGVCGFCPGGAGRCCAAPACNDGVANGSESDVDCGNAACGGCALGADCDVDGDCDSGFCQAGTCADPDTCDDGVLNGSESAVDCGGADCEPCPDLSTCTQALDCQNQNCDAQGICISCGDGVRDGTETGVDCGGGDPACRRCNFGEACGNNGDCLAGLCVAGVCN